jgi:hypothetical protein
VEIKPRLRSAFEGYFLEAFADNHYPQSSQRGLTRLPDCLVQHFMADGNASKHVFNILGTRGSVELVLLVDYVWKHNITVLRSHWHTKFLSSREFKNKMPGCNGSRCCIRI